jgi:hypothetical protein
VAKNIVIFSALLSSFYFFCKSCATTSSPKPSCD